MTQAIDIKRIYEEQAAAERNEAAEARRLSRARLNLKRQMDEIEGVIYDTDSEIG